MAIAEKLNYLLETKNQIKDAIRQKGVSIKDTDSFRSYATKIRQIESSGGNTGSSADEWQPELDWFDIEKILDEDTENYKQKAIFLLTDELDNSMTSFNIGGFQKYKLSDGQVVEQSETTELDLINLFNKEKDKECQKGYKTRYIIGYSNSNNSLNMTIPNNCIYAILNNVEYTILAVGVSNPSPFQGKYYLQGIKFINCTNSTTFFSNAFNKDYRLKSVKGLDTSNGQNFSYMFHSCVSMEKMPKLNLSNATTTTQMFYNCNSLKELFDFELSNNNIPITTTNFFYGLYCLINLKDMNGITINSTQSLSSSIYLSHASLLNLLYALADLTGQTTQKLTLGATNLAKLTDEEKAIATEKNWTLA